MESCLHDVQEIFLAHRIVLALLSTTTLLACQSESTLEGQATIPGVVEVEADPVDLDVVSAWTSTDSYTADAFIDAQAIVVNKGDFTASFQVTLIMFDEENPGQDNIVGEYVMPDLYTLEPGEEVEIYEGIQGEPLADAHCSWQIRVNVAENYRKDTNRNNNKASTNTFTVGN